MGERKTRRLEKELDRRLKKKEKNVEPDDCHTKGTNISKEAMEGKNKGMASGVSIIGARGEKIILPRPGAGSYKKLLLRAEKRIF